MLGKLVVFKDRVLESIDFALAAIIPHLLTRALLWLTGSSTWLHGEVKKKGARSAAKP